jgi:hypothetical protein
VGDERDEWLGAQERPLLERVQRKRVATNLVLDAAVVGRFDDVRQAKPKESVEGQHVVLEVGQHLIDVAAEVVGVPRKQP